MNFRIVENAPSNWEKEDEVIQQYNDGVPVAEIRKNLSICTPTFNKMIQQFKKEGKITPRRKSYLTKRKKKSPKYYTKVYNRRGFNIIKGGKYYGYVTTKNQAEKFVELMKECDWDMSMREEVKRRVVNGE